MSLVWVGRRGETKNIRGQDNANTVYGGEQSKPKQAPLTAFLSQTMDPKRNYPNNAQDDSEDQIRRVTAQRRSHIAAENIRRGRHKQCGKKWQAHRAEDERLIVSLPAALEETVLSDLDVTLCALSTQHGNP
jgi:hypothetical protein